MAPEHSGIWLDGVNVLASAIVVYTAAATLVARGIRRQSQS